MSTAAWRKTEGKMRECAHRPEICSEKLTWEILDLVYYAIKGNFLDAQAFPNLFINRSKLLISVLAPDSKQSLAFPCRLLKYAERKKSTNSELGAGSMFSLKW